MTTVCVTRGPGEDRMRATDMPADVAQHVQVAPADLLD
jgi:hypothetical protein